ncbi:hypothetical protein D3C81_1853540 [compost metagenome]
MSIRVSRHRNWNRRPWPVNGSRSKSVSNRPSSSANARKANDAGKTPSSRLPNNSARPGRRKPSPSNAEPSKRARPPPTAVATNR